MTNYETIATIVSIFGAVVALIAAGWAGVSAHAAQQQSEHAASQARAAERQLEVMQRTMTFDQISHAMRTRRLIDGLRTLTRELIASAAAKAAAPRLIGPITKDLDQTLNALVDAPPVFPPNIRRDIGNLILMVTSILPSLQSDTAPSEARRALEIAYETALDSTSAEINRHIERVDAAR